MTTSNFAADVSVEIAFDSGYSTPAASRTWTDVSAYAELNNGMTIGVGRSDERSTADANTLNLTLDNTDGRFTAGLASGAYYPNVKIGRPIRVRATYPPTAAVNKLSANAGSMETSIADWTTSGTPTPTLSQSSVRAVHGTKSLLITWQGSGGFPQANTTVTGLTIGQPYTASFWVYIPTGSANVIPVFATTTGSTYTLKDGWNRCSVTHTATATSHSIGIRGSSPGVGDTCWVDAVMVNQGTVASDFQLGGTSQTTTTRFLGYVDEWPVEWDGSESYASARITAASRMARIGLDAPLSNIISEEILLDGPAAYYTLAEPAAAAQAYDSSGNNVSRLFQAGTGTAVVFGSATGPGTDGLTAATFADGKLLKNNTGLTVSGSAVSMLIEAFVNTSVSSGGVARVVAALFTQADISAAGNATASLYMLPGGELAGRLGTGGGTMTAGVDIDDGQTHHVAFRVTVSGTTATPTLFLDGTAHTGSTFTWSTGFDELVAMSVGGDNGDPANVLHFSGTIAHAAVTFGATEVSDARILAHADAGLTGFSGETPGTRFTRYASYASIPAAEISAETGTSPMAHVDTTGAPVLDMLHLVETTDGGVLFDAADNTLTFHGRAHRYGAAVALTLDMDAQQVESDYQPKLDRSTLANDVTASITGGTVTARAVNQTSKDDYGIHASTIELATTDEEEPQQAASWRVGIYGEPSVRVPTLTFDLLPLPVATAAQALALTVGSRVQVTNHPTQAASTTGDYFVEGYTETIGPESHVFTLNVSPAGPYINVFTFDDPVLGALDGIGKLAY